MITLYDIKDAQQRIASTVKRTPCDLSDVLSAKCKQDVYLKYENLQLTGSFKARGALNRLLLLTEEERKSGVIAASAGNHAQGVAYHAQQLGIRAVIVMPETTPLNKVSKTRGYGAEIILHGDDYDTAYAYACTLAQEQSLIYIHAYNDDAIMAGQGVIGIEIAEQVENLDAVIVPVGGGGLISGIAVALKSIVPQIQVIGVEAEAMPSMQEAIRRGQPYMLPPAITVAEGIAVRRVGDRCLEVCQNYVDEIISVSDADIARAIVFLLEQEKTVAEGAGAVGVAAILSGQCRGYGRVAALVCGGNIDVNVLSRLIERGLAATGRLAHLMLKVADRPGMLARVLGDIAAVGVNVVNVYHERVFAQGSVHQVEIEVVVETQGSEHLDSLIKVLKEKKYVVHKGLSGQQVKTGRDRRTWP